MFSPSVILFAKFSRIIWVKEVKTMRALNRTISTFGRIASALAIVCFLNLSVSAYTVIMRGGRRVEVPSRFEVTATTLTYEVSPGIQVLLILEAIDIPATEKANNEEPGSLLRRAFAESHLNAQQNTSAQPATTATRTITNRDLESSMRRRTQSEIAYERRRKELGLPSVEESRRKAAAESELIAGELAETRAAQQESESYWRARASELRTEIAAVDAELGYIRRALEDPAFPNTIGNTFGTVRSFGEVTVAPAIGFGNRGSLSFPGGFSRPPARAGIFVAPRDGPQLAGRITFGGGATRGRVLLNPSGSFRSWGSDPQFGARSYGTFLNPVWQGYGVLDARSELITEFNELSAARAGLYSSWRELEEEARRAGAPPGWLRQ
jgi:hypothetical protein